MLSDGSSRGIRTRVAASDPSWTANPALYSVQREGSATGGRGELSFLQGTALGYSPGFLPASVKVEIQGCGDSPAAQFLWWVHFFLSSTDIPRIAELSGYPAVRRVINQRRPGSQRLRRSLVRRAARRAGISHLLARYRDTRDEEGSVITSSFIQQPIRLQLPAFRAAGFSEPGPQDLLFLQHGVRHGA